MSDPISIGTHRGQVEALWDQAGEPFAGVALMVGGADGGFDGPAAALYPTLVEDLRLAGVSSLRVDFRIKQFPNDVNGGVYDVSAALGWLRDRSVLRVVLVGHSFGGAVVIAAGSRSPLAAGVVTLATQTAGALRVGDLAPRPLLLIHGRNDARLPPRCSELLYEMAREPRELVLIEGATHSLRQARDEVRDLVRTFALKVLGPSR